MINNGAMLHCDKYPLYLKINHGQGCSSMVQCHIMTQIMSILKSTMVNDIYFSVYNIYLRVYILWVYNIFPLGLILFLWVHNPLGFSINPFGLLFPWVYNINALGLLFPWVSNINALGLLFP